MRTPQVTLNSQPIAPASIIHRGFSIVGEQIERLENQVNRLTERLAPVLSCAEKPPVNMTTSESIGSSLISGNLEKISESLAEICCKLDRLLEQSEL